MCVYVLLCCFYVVVVFVIGCDVVDWKVPCGLNCYVVLFLCCFKPKKKEVDCRCCCFGYSPMLYTHTHIYRQSARESIVSM